MQVLEKIKRKTQVEKTRLAEETYTVTERHPLMVLELTHDDVRNLSNAVSYGKPINQTKNIRARWGAKLMQDIVSNWNREHRKNVWPSV
mgnify:CR=1 FL=1|tara:strand:+ start:427 stop:693 length:267 start_codon:yes stop_codon:yes gene_type:complete